MQEQQIITMMGGLDLENPALQRDPGSLIACENYEATFQGYHRVDGYERFDGQPKPSEATPYSLAFDAGTVEPSVGDLIVGATSGASGFLLEAITLDSGTWGGGDGVGAMILRNVTGTFEDDEALQVSAVTQATANGTASASVGDTDAELLQYTTDARTAARALIAVVPGSGDVRGVCTYLGDKYAFRDNVGATACIMHKATSSGWSAQSFGKTLDFTSGSNEPAEGDTITGATSAATATVQRVVLQSGTWSGGDADGYLVLSGQTGTFVSENVDNTTQATANDFTISGDSADVTLPAGGKYRFEVHNFYGASNLKRLYGVNGAGYAFEWDGTVLAPIRTSVETSLDKPKFIAVQRNHLFLGYDGGHILHSGVGKPLSFQALDGAGQLGLGRDLTGMYPSTKDSLIITARTKIAYVTGNDSTDFVLNELSEESGAVEDTLQIIGQPVFLDDQGVREMSAVQAFGDWKIGTLSRKVLKILSGKKASGITPAGSLRVREKDQYRLFYTDKSVLTFYFGRENVEITQSQLEFTPTCFVSGEDADGNEILFAGGSDGYVYQLDSGTSADGAQITAYIRLAFNHQGAPNQNKRYNRARIELEGGSGTASFGVLANYSYGDPEQPESQERTYDVVGGGGFWDEFFWDDFYWSAAVQVTFHVDLDSIGTNISLTMVTDLTEEQPHTISAATIFYTPRRVLR